VDLTLYKALNGLAYGHDGFEDAVRMLTDWLPVALVALAAVLFLARGSFATRAGRRAAVAAAPSVLLALAAAHAIADLWDRARPYEAHPGVAHLFISPSPDPSFPSDHATAAFAIAVAIFLRSRRPGVLALAMATVLALSRVVLGTHYPSDVLGGAALGTAAALLFWHPRLREPLDAVADWAADVYERIAAWALDRRFRSAST
jgi:undecaprenyl-diphosphatase